MAHGVGATIVAVAAPCAAFVVGSKLQGANATAAPTTSAAANTPATSSSPVDSVPSDFLGAWHGTANDGLVGFEIELTIHAGAVGHEVATSANIGKPMGSRCERTESLSSAPPPKSP